MLWGGAATAAALEAARKRQEEEERVRAEMAQRNAEAEAREANLAHLAALAAAAAAATATAPLWLAVGGTAVVAIVTRARLEALGVPERAKSWLNGLFSDG